MLLALDTATTQSFQHFSFLDFLLSDECRLTSHLMNSVSVPEDLAPLPPIDTTYLNLAVRREKWFMRRLDFSAWRNWS
jgi:hypothetical protein